MTVCRYFAQGKCRFGDRCRFEHVGNNYGYEQQSSNYNQPNTGYHQDRYSSNYKNDGQYWNNQRYGSNGAYRSYSPQGYSESHRSYSPQGYSESYRSYSPSESYRSYSPQGYNENYYPSARSNEYGNQQQNRNRQGYGQQSRGKNQQQQQQYNYQRDDKNVYGQNRFRWLSNDYKKQTHPKGQHSENKSPNNSYRTSTPKAKTSFSFKVPESEIKKGISPLFEVNEQDQLHADMVKEDAKAWELGGQWPFTCYFPSPNKHSFPGFYDVSPEELRYAAYQAEKNNSYEAYLQSVQNAMRQINQLRAEIQIATPELFSTLRKIRDGEDLHSTSKVIDPLPPTHFTDAVIESMETPINLDAINSAAAAFSFKLPTETDSNVKTSAANFSFKLPAGTETKVIPSTASDGDIEIYTPLGSLTDEEKEQFSASTFILGKIPTKPPPQALCT